MNLQQKLIEIRKEVKNFFKDSKGYGYKFVSGSQAIGKIREKMDELGVLLLPKMGLLEHNTYDYKNSKGEDKTDFIVAGSMSYVWQNADEPSETIEIPWYLFGAQDDISKAYGSGLTYSERYFILKFFQAPTDELDPDARETSGRKNTKGNSKSFNVNVPEKTYPCSDCGTATPHNVAKFSHEKYKKILCMDCQKKQ